MEEDMRMEEKKLTLTREIKPGVLSVGAIDWDRRLFDALIPLPDGTSYNSYLIRGQDKTALIDAVDATMADVLIDNLKALDIKKIDYIVAQHAEQDHSGSSEKAGRALPRCQSGRLSQMPGAAQ